LSRSPRAPWLLVLPLLLRWNKDELLAIGVGGKDKAVITEPATDAVGLRSPATDASPPLRSASPLWPPASIPLSLRRRGLA
jgi:hypothetical protein